MGVLVRKNSCCMISICARGRLWAVPSGASIAKEAARKFFLRIRGFGLFPVSVVTGQSDVPHDRNDPRSARTRDNFSSGTGDRRQWANRSRSAFASAQVTEWSYQVHELPQGRARKPRAGVPGLPQGDWGAHRGAARVSRVVAKGGHNQPRLPALPRRAQRGRRLAGALGAVAGGLRSPQDRLHPGGQTCHAGMPPLSCPGTHCRG